MIKTRTGHDLREFDMKEVLRCISRRMKIQQLEQLHAYTDKILHFPEETVMLCNELTLMMSSFFRDKQLLHHIQDEILPQLLDKKSTNESLRVWVVGCSTGEDAYSLAMIIQEVMDQYPRHARPQIFASDFSEPLLQKARVGFFPGNLHQDIDHTRLQRFFTSVRDGYQVSAVLRDKLIFSQHNLLQDPPFSKIDLLFCGDFLHKLTLPTRKELVDIFSYSLVPGGYLAVSSDLVETDPGQFRKVDDRLHLYQNNRVNRHALASVFPRFKFDQKKTQDNTNYKQKPARLHEQLLISQVSSLLVNKQQEVLHVAGKAGRYLAFPAGTFRPQLMNLLLHPLRAPVESVLNKVLNQQQGQRTAPLVFPINGFLRQVIVSISYVHESDQEPMLLLLFDESSPEEHKQEEADKQKNVHSSPPTKETLNGYEKSQMQLQAANEELQSTNEELNAALEEVRLTSEELQSANEELRTLDQENRIQLNELQKLSDDLENLLVSTDLAILFLDKNLHIQRFTPKTKELFNLREEDRGRKITDQTHHLRYGELTEDIEKVYQSLVPEEREITDEKGQWYLVKLLPYRTGSDQIAGVVLNFINITARRQKEQMEREMQTAAETAKAKDEFLSTVSHEIRTPLNAIIGLSDILLKRRPRKDQTQNLETLHFSAQGLLQLVNEILDFSKLQAGKMEVETLTYQPQSLLESLKNAHKPKAQEKKLALQLEMEQELPQVLRGDPHKLTQVLHNLLSNAIKFTEKGEVRVKLSQTKRKAKSVELLVEVQDTGIGITDGQEKRIFEKFSQADITTARRYGGTGLGLAISRSLLQLMGSDMQLESKEGQGTRFFFKLWQEIGQEESSSPKAQDTNEAERVQETVKQARILVAEDSVINQMVLQQYLEEWWQKESDVAENGKVALEKAAQQNYDLILMDIRMPEMDGKEATRRIRQLNAHYQKIPIVALTADLKVAESEDARFDALVSKPFQPDHLRQTIVDLLKQSINQTSALSDQGALSVKEQAKDKLKPDLEKAEAPFEGTPEKKYRFYQMVIENLEGLRTSLPGYFEARNMSQLEDLMHKQKSLFSMFNLDDFYKEIQQARQNLENHPSANTLPPAIDQGLATIVTYLQEKLESLPASNQDQ